MSYLFVHVDSDREYLRAPGEELQTDLGVLEIPEEVTPGDELTTHLDERFRVRALRGPDLFDHLERTGAPMMPRDIGLVVGHTGLCATDRVLDAGTGTGVLATYMGRIGADVVTYERDAEFAEVARENVSLASVGDRVSVRVGDVTAEFDDLADAAERDGPDGRFDVLTLDTEDAPAVVARAPEVLARGGYVAVYTPFIEAARETVAAAREAGLEDVETLETIQREMQFDDRGSRPSTAGVGHTGYLTFARRL
ncbi:MAG: methyltransferase domain-containing protein [Halolamina sp.]